MASRFPPVSGKICQVSECLCDPVNTPLQPRALGFLVGRFVLAGIAATEPGIQFLYNGELELSSGSCLERHVAAENRPGTDTVDI